MVWFRFANGPVYFGERSGLISGVVCVTCGNCLVYLLSWSVFQVGVVCFNFLRLGAVWLPCGVDLLYLRACSPLWLDVIAYVVGGGRVYV